MSEKVVLPKFDLPGKQMHPAVKLAWMAGVLLAVAVLALGGALWRHRAMEVAEENRKQAEIAAKTAEANAAAEAAKAQVEVAKMNVALAQAKAKEAAAVKANPPGDAKVAATSGRHRGGHHGSSKAAAKTTVAKGGAEDKAKPGAKSGKKGDDVVDKLLASFK